MKHRTWVRYAVALAVCALVAAYPTFVGRFYTNVGFLIAIFVVAAVGMNVLVGYTGTVSLGHAGLMAIGAYVTAYLSTTVGWSPWVTTMLATVAAGVVGTILGFAVLRAGGLYLALMTIAFGVVISQVALRWSTVTGGALGTSGIPRYSIGGFEFGLVETYYLTAALALAALVLGRNVRQSRVGRSMLAVREDPIASQSLGISPFIARSTGFSISSVLAGLAGALYAHANNFISPDNFTILVSIELVLITILGGAGTVWGAAVGSGVLKSLPIVVDALDTLRLATYGLLMLLVLYALPKGIVGSIKELFARVVPRPSEPHRQRDLDDPAQLVRVMRVNSRDDRDQDEVILSVAGLSMSFDGLQVLKDLSIDVRFGEIHALIGPNGAGKSTVVNLISGYFPPTGGSVSLRQETLTGKTAAQVAGYGVARLFQHTRLFSSLSVLENVMIGVEKTAKQPVGSGLLRLPTAVRHDREVVEAAHQYLDLVGYEGPRLLAAEGLAMGHQKQVELARALATRPEVLLLDEPAAGLTSGEIEELEGLIKSLQDAGLSILLIEHHMDLVGRISDRVTVIDYGVKIAEGTPEKVRTDPKVIEAYLGSEEVGSA